MEEYVRLKDIPKHFGIKKGDSVWVASDVKTLIYTCMENGDDTDLNILIDSIKDLITEEGTLMIPVFNWDFCKGIPFDVRRSPSKGMILSGRHIRSILLRYGERMQKSLQQWIIKAPLARAALFRTAGK